MIYTNAGKSGLKVSVFALGTWAFSADGYWGEQDTKDSYNTIASAMDMGVTLFDSSEMYGAGFAEEILGKALKGHRSKVLVATKVGAHNLGRDDLIAACERSLKRLQTDYIDLYQIHWPNLSVPFEETCEAMEILVKNGKVRYSGVCNFGVKNLDRLLRLGKCVSNQLPYSLLWRAVEYEIIPECIKNEVGILTYSSLSQGLLSGKYRNVEEVPKGRTGTRFFDSRRGNGRHGEMGLEKETFETVDRISEICGKISQPISRVSLAWIISRPGISSVVAGARTPEQLKDIVKATELRLPGEIADELTSVTEDLKERVGNNPDMWENREKSRFL